MGQEFEDYYRARYGSRWDSLRKSLLEPPAMTAYREGLSRPYYLDRASILAARSLRLPERGTLLDACAAPGGKSLVIASVMGPDLCLLSNELSHERRRRLVRVLDEHLEGELRARVRVSGFNAAASAARKTEHGRFSGILLDAPCSGERHLMQNERALAEWTPARPRFLARRQWALLSAAFLLLEAGSSLVYATCALGPEENDGVALRLLRKYKDRVIQDEPDFTEGERTGYGRIILPDACEGMGPMYVARFRKRA
ncbi:MAG: 16S rRNA methyltransferase [Treponema sp.]|jgi:16S rRNA (cytosine1407-C5)-methyltransferase|nr:16S rRNA methyltransferase [Treponema sp.]